MPKVLSYALLILLGVLLMRPVNVKAETAIGVYETSDGLFTYFEYSDYVEITAYNSTNSVVVVPSAINGKTVKTIIYSTFEGNADITHVTLPDSVNSVEMFQFRGCTSLKSVTIPNSVTKIEVDAFKNCSNLESLYLPASVSVIKDNFVAGCSSLKRITIENTTATVSGNAFSNSESSHEAINDFLILYIDEASTAAAVLPNINAYRKYTVRERSESPDRPSSGGSGSSSSGSSGSGSGSRSLPDTADADSRYPILILFVLSLSSCLALGLVKRKTAK